MEEDLLKRIQAAKAMLAGDRQVYADLQGISVLEWKRQMKAAIANLAEQLYLANREAR